MLADIIISGITFIAVVATLIFSVWTYIDTKRKYSHNQFLVEREKKRKDAEERFKNRTRLRRK